MNESRKILNLFEDADLGPGFRYDNLLDTFAKMLQDKINEYYKKAYPNVKPGEVKLKPGKQYTKIDVGGGGKFMYDPLDGCIYFIKGYGVIDKKKNFGHIKNIVDRDFDFDGYSIVPKGSGIRTMYGYGGRIG